MQDDEELLEEKSIYIQKTCYDEMLQLVISQKLYDMIELNIYDEEIEELG